MPRRKSLTPRRSNSSSSSSYREQVYSRHSVETNSLSVSETQSNGHVISGTGCEMGTEMDTVGTHYAAILVLGILLRIGLVVFGLYVDAVCMYKLFIHLKVITVSMTLML